MITMEEKSYGKISYSIDARRKSSEGKNKDVTDTPHPKWSGIRNASQNAEDITPAEAFLIAQNIISTFKKTGLNEYIKYKKDSMTSGGHFLALLVNDPEIIIDRELSLARRIARERKTQEIFDELQAYEREAANIKLLTPYLIADAEECVRRLAGNVEKK